VEEREFALEQQLLMACSMKFGFTLFTDPNTEADQSVYKNCHVNSQITYYLGAESADALSAICSRTGRI